MNDAPAAKASSPSVLILGRGLVAQTCALALADAGFAVTLLGPEPRRVPATTRFDSRVFALNAASKALLENLRVWPALEVSAMSPVREMHLLSDGETVQISAFQSRVAELATIVQARQLSTALDAAVRFQSRITLLCEAAIALDTAAGIVQTACGTRSAALVLLAEPGLAEKLCPQAIQTHARPYSASAIVGTVELPKVHCGVARQWFHAAEPGQPPGVLALLPLENGNFASFVWSTTQAQMLWAQPDLLTALQSRLQQITGEPLTLCAQSQAELGLWPLVRAQAAPVFAGRVLAVGDAAHRIHPLAGLGLNLGLQDAAELPKVLAQRERFRELADPKVLARYERARAPQVQAASALTDALWRLHLSQSAALKAAGPVRRFGVKLLNRSGAAKRFLVQAANHAFAA